MARRTSKQRGTLEEKDGRLTLRYSIREAGRWKERREALPRGISRDEAEQLRIERMTQVNAQNSGVLANPTMSLKKFVETLWADYLTRRNVKASTVYSYDSMLRRHVLPQLGSMPVGAITPIHITLTMNGAAERSPKHRLNLYAMLKVMFEVAREYDLIRQSPVRLKLHRPIIKRQKRAVYTPDQLPALARSIPPEYRLLVLTLGTLGLRLGEALGFWWEDFDGTALTVSHSQWRQQRQDSPKTDESVKRIVLPPVIAELLKTARSEARWSGATDYIFCRQDTGAPLDQDHLRRVVLYPSLKAAGIERVKGQAFHALRHAAGSILYEMTRDIEAVKDFLRHSRINTTSDIYVHTSNEVRAEGPAMVAQAFFRNVHEVEGVQ